MNLLAHLHLSAGLDAEGTAGNVLADFLPNDTKPPPGIARGITVHRHIDGFTDRNPLVAEARELISRPRRRLASIIVDVAFDYTLTQAWGEHSDSPLDDFIQRGYGTVQYGSRNLSERANQMVTRMRQNRWLESYTTMSGLALTFRRISRRSEVVEKLVGAEEEIAATLPQLQILFDTYYPELIHEVAELLRRMEALPTEDPLRGES